MVSKGKWDPITQENRVGLLEKNGFFGYTEAGGHPNDE
jgi:hypothetical protein